MGKPAGIRLAIICWYLIRVKISKKKEKKEKNLCITSNRQEIQIKIITDTYLVGFYTAWLNNN